MKSLNIVLVEDSKTSAIMMTDIIRDLGCNVEAIYTNGEELIQEIDDVEIDVLLTDIELEGELNGVEMVEKFKKKKPTIPFFFVTSHEDIYTLKAAAATNPWGFLNKPVDKLTLRNTFEILINNKKTIDFFVKKVEELEHEKKMLNIMSKELSETNNHLISATWRERDLKKELQESKKIIEEQHSFITDSINYSHRIQKSMIAKEEHFSQYFAKSFIYYKPKDIVSGDFPWSFKKDDYLYFAAVDCTGHGVPGAMLATIGTLLLNDIVNDDGIIDTNHILDKLHLSIVETLNQENDCEAANDGMDIAICRYHIGTKKLQFSGAHRPLYIITQEGTTRMKSNAYPIGGMQYKRRKPFKVHEVQLKKGDVFFIYSDGIPDQFGGGNDEKFGNQKIIEIFEGNKIESVKEAIDQSISQWMKVEDAPQIDDMLLIGVEI